MQFLAVWNLLCFLAGRRARSSGGPRPSAARSHNDQNNVTFSSSICCSIRLIDQQLCYQAAMLVVQIVQMEQPLAAGRYAYRPTACNIVLIIVLGRPSRARRCMQHVTPSIEIKMNCDGHGVFSGYFQRMFENDGALWYLPGYFLNDVKNGTPSGYFRSIFEVIDINGVSHIRDILNGFCDGGSVYFRSIM